MPLLPDVVHRAFRGDYVPLAQEYVGRVGSGLDARARLAMSFEILCSESWARFDPVRVAQSSTGSYLAEVAESRARLFDEACRFVPEGVVSADADRVAPTDVPVLILAGSADPQDPPANMRGWKTLFPNGRLVIVPGATHGVLDRGLRRARRGTVRRRRNRAGPRHLLRAADRAAGVRDARLS